MHLIHRQGLENVRFLSILIGIDWPKRLALLLLELLCFLIFIDDELRSLLLGSTSFHRLVDLDVLLVHSHSTCLQTSCMHLIAFVQLLLCRGLIMPFVFFGWRAVGWLLLVANVLNQLVDLFFVDFDDRLIEEVHILAVHLAFVFLFKIR